MVSAPKTTLIMRQPRGLFPKYFMPPAIISFPSGGASGFGLGACASRAIEEPTYWHSSRRNSGGFPISRKKNAKDIRHNSSAVTVVLISPVKLSPAYNYIEDREETGFEIASGFPERNDEIESKPSGMASGSATAVSFPFLQAIQN